MDSVIELMAIMLQLSHELFETLFDLHYELYCLLKHPWIKMQVRNRSEDQEAPYITCQISTKDSHVLNKIVRTSLESDKGQVYLT
jgi:hypothetical protein